MNELDIIRRAYAKQVMAAADVRDRNIEDAFATVPREAFLGPGPWPILRSGSGYVRSPSDDPVYVYADVLVGLMPERRINNGQPSLHARLLAGLGPRPGDHIVHVGAGTGYYTAILACLVGPGGRVTALELEPDLARRAAENLRSFPQAAVVCSDGATADFGCVDGLYVNAGATRPADLWLDRLQDGGRLIVPLTVPGRRAPGDPFGPAVAQGAVFRIERRGPSYAAQWLGPIEVLPCVGQARNEHGAEALRHALRKGGQEFVRSLHRHNDVPFERCWLWADGWCLSYDEPT